MRESENILRRLLRRRYPAGVVRLEDEIAETAISLLGVDRSSAESLANTSVRSIWKRVLAITDSEKRRGLHPTFEILDPSRFELSWYPRLLSADDARTVRRKLRLAHRGDMLDYIDDNANVDPRQYEALGCVVCQLCSAKSVHLTPPGNEFGIDFFALLPAHATGHLFPYISKQLKIVGQSKKWSSKISRDQVDLLANRLDDIRRRNERLASIIPSWFSAALGPLVGCIICHSGAQSGAHDFAQDHGIVVADSRDVSEIIVLSKQWDSARYPGPSTFLASRISALL